MAITLVGKEISDIGTEFYYLGPMDDCGDCKLKGVCFNLEEGARYRVTAVREQEHDCPLLEDERVTAVEVEKVPTPAILPKKGLLEGITITYVPSKCENVSCQHWGLCHPTGKIEGSKYNVIKMEGDVDCPLNERLAFVELF